MIEQQSRKTSEGLSYEERKNLTQHYSQEVLHLIHEICVDFFYLDDVLLAIIVPIGVFGNALCIYMYRRKNMVKSNLSPFNINISVWNIIYILYFLLVIESDHLYHYNLEFASDAACPILVYFKQVLRQIPIWLEVYLTFDRFCSICYPNKFKWVRKREHITPICFLLIFICCVLNIEHFWFHLDHNIPLWPDGIGVSTEILGYHAPVYIK